MRIARVVVLAVFCLVSSCSEDTQTITQRAQTDKVVSVASDDPAMLRAFSKARASLDAFLSRVAASDPAVTSASLKVRIKDGDVIEYFWVVPFSPTPNGFSGTINNDPEVVTNVRFGQVIEFQRSEIYDWTYVDANSGKLIGNFTACALLVHETPAAVAEFKRSYNLDCDT